MKKWFCTWNDLLRLFAIARVANPKTGLNLIPKPEQSLGNVNKKAFMATRQFL
jgi:biotin synthase-like enzyme